MDINKCKGCGQCVRVCPAIVFELKEKRSRVVYGEGCYACGHCWAVCPEEAVFQQEVATTTGIKPGPDPAVPADALQLLIRERRSKGCRIVLQNEARWSGSRLVASLRCGLSIPEKPEGEKCLFPIAFWIGGHPDARSSF